MREPPVSPQHEPEAGSLHLLIDCWGAPADSLDDPEQVRKAVLVATAVAGATVIDLCVHRFSPHGVTAVATLMESHLAVHTWPERGYFAADLFFCGRGQPEQAIDCLAASLGAREVRVRRLLRGPGAPDREPDIRVGSMTEIECDVRSLEPA
jgi:S-adenosylmethionine decarboxylase